MSKSTIIIVICIGLAALLGATFYWHFSVKNSVPTPTVAATQADAKALAEAQQAKSGGTVYHVYGTGSMQPHIPAAPAGKDPKTTIVAYVLTDPTITYANLKKGLCIYEMGGENRVHVAAQKDSLGWVMTGTNNPRSESGTRMTEKNFKGRVSHIYTWPQ